MIAFLRGLLVEKTSDMAFLDVAGVGYGVGMSSTSLSKLPDLGQEVRIYTYMQVREDAVSLYGFLNPDEKNLFMRLIGVSGIGPKVALAALSTYAAEALIAAIVAQDNAAISRIPGVGKKTASRILLELKDAFEMPTSIPVQSEVPQESSTTQHISEALLSMGFTSAEAELALQGAPEGADEGSLLQYALKRLGSV